jgi:predicted aspartyl protease
MRQVPKVFSILAVGFFAMAAFPALAADNGCELKRIASLPLIGNPGGIPVVDVTLAGQKRRLVVHTAAFWSHLNKGTVRELGLPTIFANNVKSVSADGSLSNEYVHVPETLVGNMRAANMEFMVDGSSDPNETIGEGGLAGMLGTEILKQFDIDFDFAGHRMNVFSQDHCAGKAVYWQDPKVVVVAFKLDPNGNNVTFPVRVNGTRMNAILNTGFSFTTLTEVAAKRALDFDKDAPGVRQVGDINGKAAVYQTTAKGIEIEGLKLAESEVNVIPDLMAKVTQRTELGSLIPRSDVTLPSVMLGMSTLGNMHVYIAYKERKLYISQAATTDLVPTGPAVP